MKDAADAGRSATAAALAVDRLAPTPRYSTPAKKAETHVTRAVAVPLSLAGRFRCATRLARYRAETCPRPKAARFLEAGSRNQHLAPTPSPMATIGTRTVSSRRWAARPSSGDRASVRRRKTPAAQKRAGSAGSDASAGCITSPSPSGRGSSRRTRNWISMGIPEGESQSETLK